MRIKIRFVTRPFTIGRLDGVKNSDRALPVYRCDLCSGDRNRCHGGIVKLFDVSIPGLRIGVETA